MGNYYENEYDQYIMYLDVSNVYGWAMSQPLPTGYFRWEDPNDHCIFNGILNTYRRNLHSDYPKAPEKNYENETERREECRSRNIETNTEDLRQRREENDARRHLDAEELGPRRSSRLGRCQRDSILTT
ncbi:hypothetical protein MAR_002194 [Mya arenaria]|uniref:DNA-directed DNA polymerase n=1 Tax=Mya arenaria TaxID=6604 RepID=A0ABY7FHE9_MYAAR|nr:hypothetical protein MAR_002194 [Mya arenaria]